MDFEGFVKLDVIFFIPCQGGTVIIELFIRMCIHYIANHRLTMFFFILAHIFFDDAFDFHSLEEYEYQANDYVKMMFACMDLAAR